MQQHYAQQYRDLWRRHWWWRSRRRFVLSRVQHIAQRAPIRRIFDIGCGDGLMFDDLKQFGEPWGLEPDAGLLSDDGPHRDRIEVGALDDGFQCEHT
ncbi:MAG: class I SAM-dependent methyltransferase, partial [Phycisphaeraceae bacterium]